MGLSRGGSGRNQLLPPTLKAWEASWWNPKIAVLSLGVCLYLQLWSICAYMYAQLTLRKDYMLESDRFDQLS